PPKCSVYAPLESKGPITRNLHLIPNAWMDGTLGGLAPGDGGRGQLFEITFRLGHGWSAQPSPNAARSADDGPLLLLLIPTDSVVVVLHVGQASLAHRSTRNFG